MNTVLLCFILIAMEYLNTTAQSLDYLSLKRSTFPNAPESLFEAL